MATKVSADKVLTDAAGIDKVWKANPDLKLGKGDDTVTLADYEATIKAVEDFNDEIENLRSQLNGKLDRRDITAATLSGYNTRARSLIRGTFGPDAPEYDQAGGTRTSERKSPTRKTPAPAKNN